jgi:antitoxin (DNA-binding transcriptional repressor) of toxin-antitoxin stability system
MTNSPTRITPPIQRRLATACLLLAALLHQPAAHAQAEREAWLDRMSTAIPAMFCQPGQYFRSCFTASAEECEEAAASAARVCIRQYRDRIPEILDRAAAGEQGSVLGSCAGTAFETMFAKRRLSNERCDDPNNWR